MKIEGPLAVQLARAFDEMFALADFKRGPLERLRRSREQKIISTPEGTLLLGAPGRQRSPLRSALHQDLKRARHVKITSAYFLPTWRIRRELFQIVRRGGRVQLILPAKSDVALSQLASRSLYRRFLRAGIEIHEYQPQILHAKLIIIDDIVYAGSANLDVRSLQMNYELLVRMSNHRVAEEARQIFEGDLQHSKEILPAAWRRSRNFWNRMQGRWAYFLLARLDPFLARQQLKRLR